MKFFVTLAALLIVSKAQQNLKAEVRDTQIFQITMD